MKRIVITILCGLFALSALAQTKAPTAFEPVPSLPITGSLSIDYRTRRAPGKEGITDVYTLNLNVANSAAFKGTIAQLPFIKNTVSKNQMGRVIYDMELEVINPANIRQSRVVGKAFGYAPVDENNAFKFGDQPGVKFAINGIGAAQGFESRFGGTANGKPPPASGLAKLKKDAVTLMSGKGGKIVLVNYDKMSFDNHVLPRGPVGIYPETSVNGTMLFDYNRNCWYFNNLRFEYPAENRRASDVLTGNIRWVEAKNRRSTGEGYYAVDIRVNEPLPSESQVFSATADESAFFASSDDVPGLSGTIQYKDVFVGETVVSSAVNIDLKATKLSKAQVVMLSKLLFLSAIVPINAE